MLQICGYEEPVGFLVQIVYKKAYGDENTTFEPLNLWTRERLLYIFVMRNVVPSFS